MLLPSANNVADTMAIWAFGSMESYISYANEMVKDLGMNKTHIADASGFSPNTTSTAHDLVLLGQAAMKSSVVKEIVSQEKATLPVAGVVNNVNLLLGSNGVIGIKTGTTDEAGGCFLQAAEHTFENGQKLIIVTAIMGAPNRPTALADSKNILPSIYKGFGDREIAAKGKTIGHYDVPWAASVTAATAEKLSVFTWKGSTVQVAVKLNPLNAPALNNAEVGNVSLTSGSKTASVKAVTSSALGEPSINWRVGRGF
jgi:D-alanyl-D-alanine carboxypeptidase (penicillin-binding protein 5/6)